MADIDGTELRHDFRGQESREHDDIVRRMLNSVCLCALVAMLLFTWRAFTGPNRLPERFPTHFDFHGNPNGWGTPKTFFILPIVATILYAGFTVVTRFPALFNYPVRVTPENRPHLEKIAIDMMIWLKAEIVCLMAWLQIVTLRMAQSGGNRLPAILVPVAIATIFVTIATHLVAMIKAARVSEKL